MLDEKIKNLPKAPGVYLMKDRSGAILYIGKAANLADRVRSYFTKSVVPNPRIRSMLDQVGDVETIVTGSDLEALILENNLIKKHRPKYNVVLRDDKNYPLLRLALKEEPPSLQIVRRAKRDGVLYFGPYVPTHALRETLRLLRRAFPLFSCTLKAMANRRPCLECQINRCAGPCTGSVEAWQIYRKMLEQVRLFLEGRDLELVKQLKGEMKAAAEALEYEKAARIRDQIEKIERTLERQRITSPRDRSDRDVIGLASSGEAADLQVLFVRGGMLIGKKDFFFTNIADATEEEMVISFLKQFYAKEGLLPEEVAVPFPLPPAEKESLEKYLSAKKGAPVKISFRSRGRDARLVDLARENAEASLEERLRRQDVGDEAVTALAGLLNLPRLPRWIEAFDVSNIGGSGSVASMVVAERGKMVPSHYRHFKLATPGPDDFAMMREVITRRYSKKPLPDLILVDGGRGQLSAALESLSSLGHPSVLAIGLAKEREEKFERVYLPGAAEPVVLPEGSAATHLLMRIRDEAHRFAIRYHRKLRGKGIAFSELEQISGIGEERKVALLKHFGSLEEIRKAPVEALARAPLMNRRVAQEVYSALHS